MDLNSIVGAATAAVQSTVAGAVTKVADMAEQAGVPGVEAIIDQAEAATGMDLDGKPEGAADVADAAHEAPEAEAAM
jgi:hypothetical protein